MNERADQAKSIFLEAIEQHAPEQWPSYLNKACGDDQPLRADVEKLLNAQVNIGSFHERPRPQLGATIDQPAPERPGNVIGPYKLLQQIGEGGMGDVWMAEQSEPIQRRVAIKVIKAGMDSKQVLARFDAERQALALMDHPNIAKVLDAGATTTGRPYFVMELVKGTPITRFCDEKKLNVRERLELFGDVCRAVQHAHQKGIIHRDIKPSNVLVAPYDGKPVVKVIDFGVAKATGQKLTDATLFTGFGAVVGTPEYMSPEQAEVNNQDIDTRSDIYSLGVLLYELLTGSTPLTKKRVKDAAFLEVLRVIREEEPPKPSTRLSSTEELPSISAQRHSEPAKLTKLVRGELDWIVMKALEKDRNRRYETANGFAMDVQRYLADEAVQACPPSAWYRLRKFSRRNKPVLATASAVAVAVVLAVAALAASTILIARALQSETEAKGQLTAALDRERRDAYFHRIALAHRELLENNLLQAEEILDQCPDEHRAWEWYYLKRLCRVEPVTLRGQPSWLHKVAFSPDGRRIASASDDKTVKVWDATTGQQLLVLPDAGEVRCAAFRPPDGRWLVTGDRSGALSVWDTATGQVTRFVGRHADAVRDVAFTPDGRLLATASDDKTVKVWDATSRGLLYNLSNHEREVIAVAISPDGQHLASGSLDATVNIWDMTTGKPIRTLRGHTGPVSGVAFSPDGLRLASASRDRTVRVWDVTTGQPTLILDEHILFVFGVAFIDDGRRLASVSADKTMKIWDATTGQVVLTLRGHNRELIGMACSPDGRRLASVGEDRTTKIWDATPLAGVATGEHALTLRGHTDQIWGLAFSPDGRRLASASRDMTARVWNIRSGREDLAFRKHVKIVFSVAFSPDGERIVSGSVSHGQGEPSYLKVWHAATGEEVLSPGQGTGEAFVVAISPDKGGWIATADERGDVTVWDATTGRVVHTFGTRGRRVFGLAFSPDGRRLASLNGEGVVTVYDTTRFEGKVPEEPLLTFRAHNTPTRGTIGFSPNSRRLAVPGDDNTVNIWDVTTTDQQRVSAPKLTLRGHTAQVWGVAFSPDGRWVASGGEDNTVRIWNAESGGDPVRTFREHTSVVSRVAFSPDRKNPVLASASFDKTVKVWDVTSLYEKVNK